MDPTGGGFAPIRDLERVIRFEANGTVRCRLVCSRRPRLDSLVVPLVRLSRPRFSPFRHPRDPIVSFPPPPSSFFPASGNREEPELSRPVPTITPFVHRFRTDLPCVHPYTPPDGIPLQPHPLAT